MSVEYKIIEATESDAEEILRLQYAAYQSEAEIYNNYSVQPLTQTLEETIEEFKECTVLKAASDGKIIGSVRATVQNDSSIYISKLMVLPGYQNRGIGKRLLKAIEDEFPNKRYWLITGHKSEKNLRLYEKHGYTRFKTEEAAPWLTLIHLEKQICIHSITENKKDFLPLLLLGDESESHINKYLESGELFAMYNGDLKSICVVTDNGNGTLEIQNIATDQRYQRHGYASRLIDYIAQHYAGRYNRIILGTGDVPGILCFYERCGFAITHRVPDYFITHYDHPIFEDGVLLKDKVYLERKLV
jgi:ribosomal protein S18 acetylase RimI-like enzyme